MHFVSLIAVRLYLRICVALTAVSALIPVFAGAHDILATAVPNLRWSAAAKSAKVTFLGKDEKETAVLVVKKSAVLGTEFSIQSDASTITLVSADVRISFAIPAGGVDGTTSRVKLEGGAEPSLLFNGNELARNRGKWIQIAGSQEVNLTIELAGATFATVTFDSKLAEAAPAQPVAVAIPATAGPSAPSHELIKDVTPSQLRAASTAFATAVHHKCPRCSGSGKVTVSEQTGTRREGNLIRKVYQDFQRTCDKCDGAREIRANSEALNRFAATFVKTLASTRTDDPKAQDAISDAYKMITDYMIADYKTWVSLTENGRSILSQKSPMRGSPVIAKALVKQSLPAEGGKRQFLVEIGGTDKLVLVYDPVSADEVRTGPALIGGLVEPYEKQTATQRPVAVLNRGFLVAPPIQSGWTWWYWWRDRP